MNYGEQVLWAKRVLENPEAAQRALNAIKYFQDEFDGLPKEFEPDDKEAQQFYYDMLANSLVEFAFSIRRD